MIRNDNRRLARSFNLCYRYTDDPIDFKVVGSCRIFSAKRSDTFRSIFVFGKELESRKTVCHNRAKNSPP